MAGNAARVAHMAVPAVVSAPRPVKSCHRPESRPIRHPLVGGRGQCAHVSASSCSATEAPVT
eukprot:scaffold5016_cov118-Isochrysis_galbana.AAC.15